MAALRTAIAAGLAFLWRAQTPEGFWRDWHLPPGESRAWTTAYVGWRLSGLGTRLQSAAARRLDAAAAWLSEAELPGGGWGYAPVTGPDADSTALAALFLRARGIAAPSAVRVLLAHQQEDGGFATYTRAGSHGAWTSSHPEVTAVALLALAGEPDAPVGAIDAGTRYLRRVRRPDGRWPSYWWTSPLYATDVALTCLGAGVDAGWRSIAEAVRLTPAPTAFDVALQVLCLLRLGDADGASIRAATLARAQSADGSWPSGAVLRLTHRQVIAPWDTVDAGPLFADLRRTFATATAVAALDAVVAASAAG